MNSDHVFKGNLFQGKVAIVTGGGTGIGMPIQSFTAWCQDTL